MRRGAMLAADLGWVAFSPFLALFIRDNLLLYPGRLEAIIAYAAILVAVSAMTFLVARLHNTLWQYTSLFDVLRVMGAVTVALLLALCASFVLNRLEGIARSVPVIQWFLMVAALVGTRIGFRIWHEHARRNGSTRADASVQHILIVGLSHLTHLYLQSVAEYASKTIDVVGILSDRKQSHGRLLRRQRILGAPEDLPKVMAQLEVHGIILKRIVVMQPFEQLSRSAGEALLALERSSGVKVEWMLERLGLTEDELRAEQRPLEYPSQEFHARQASSAELEVRSFGSYRYVKRIFDVSLALFLAVALIPVICIVSLLVALDVGFPLVFWQQRPGQFGRPFKLFKFRTMRAAHDPRGNRIPDEQRSSLVGDMLRRTRLDELPQLYNILIGEMSFVGPRPLLAIDQPEDMNLRLSVRPGLTGFAQVNGGRNISVEDKNALDIWYVRNASLWFDIKILLSDSKGLDKG